MAFSFKTWTAETLTSSDLNSEFSKIESKFGSLTNADLSDQAYITSSKLQDRYAVMCQTIPIHGATWGSSSGFTFQDNATQGSVTELRVYPEFPGKRAYLVSISVSVSNYTTGTGDGQIWFSLSGTLINSVIITADDTVQYIRNSSGASAFSSPIAALTTGDYIGIQCGRDATGGTVSADAIGITLTYKVELTS